VSNISLHYIPDHSRLEVIDKDGDCLEYYTAVIDRKYLKDLSNDYKEITVYDEDSDGDVEDEVLYYVIPILFFVQLVSNQTIRLNGFDKRSIMSDISGGERLVRTARIF
jgi:hypothetical protein